MLLVLLVFIARSRTLQGMAIVRQIIRVSGTFFLLSISGLMANPLTELTVSQSYYAPGSSTPAVTSLSFPYSNAAQFQTTWNPSGSLVGASVKGYSGVVNVSFSSCTGAPLQVGTFSGAALVCGPGTGTIGMGFAPIDVYDLYGEMNNSVATGSVTISQVSFDSSGNLISFAASYIIDSLTSNPAYPGYATYTGQLYINADPAASSVPEPASTGLAASALLVVGMLVGTLRKLF